MELHQLRYFLAVVDEGTFTAAADAVRISQSGVSTQIQKLERELGVALLDRSARQVTLTPAGVRLVPYARSAVAAVDAVTGAANDLRGLVVGSLRVGTVTGPVFSRLFDALATLHAEHPGLDLGLEEGASDNLIAQVRAGTLDVAIAAWSNAAPEGVEVSVIVDDELVAVVGHGHPWAARQRIRPAELARADLIALPRGTGARAALDGLTARLGTTTTPRWEVATPAYVELLAARGLGVGIVSATTAADWEDVISLRIADKEARSQLGIVWSTRPSHAAQALVGQLVPDGSRHATSVARQGVRS